MRRRIDLRVLFATSFSPACVRAGRALEQLARSAYLDVTVVHATAGASRTEVRRALDATVPDPQGRFRCRRIALEARDPAVAVAALCEAGGFDLALIPGSGRFPWSNLTRGSFRQRFRERCRVPVWTMGHGANGVDFDAPLRAVGCLVDFEDQPGPVLRQAAALADLLDVPLHAIAALPPIDDALIGAVGTGTSPLCPVEATRRIRAMTAGARVRVDVAVVREPLGGTLRHAIRDSGVAVLVVGPRRSATAGWTRGVAPLLERLPCAVVCVDDTEEMPAHVDGREPGARRAAARVAAARTALA